MESSSSLLNVVNHGKKPTSRPRSESADAKDRFSFSFLDRFDKFEREYFHIPMQALAKSIPGMCTLMTTFGATCTGEGLVSFFGLLCWTISVNACIHGIWLVPVVEVLNGLIKWQFGRPRPGWNDPRVDVLSTSHEYSFPSSHAMLSWSLATFFAYYWYDNVGTGQTPTSIPIYYAFYCHAAAVSISRVFDGAHYPKDIIIGGFLGRQIGYAHYHITLPYFKANAKLNSTQPMMQIMSGNLISVAMLVVTLICYTIAKRRWGKAPKKWCLLACVKQDNLQPHFVPLFDYVGMCGVFSGLSVAEVVMNSTRPGLLLPTSWLDSLLRIVVGLLVLIGMWFAVRAIEKGMATNTVTRLLLRFIRYAQVPPIILLVAPACFEAIGI